MCVVGSFCLGYADDWPRFRGPSQDNVSSEKGWLDVWPDQGPKIAWKADVGLGYSSFVVAQNRAYTIGHANKTDTIFCFDAATGAQIWKHSYAAELGAKYFQGGTTGTPTIEKDRLYWLGRWGDLFCFEASSGNIIWSTNVHRVTGIRIPDWGYTGAPYIHQDLLVLNVGDAGIGVNKNSGQLVWSSANKDSGYSTPLRLQQGSNPLVVFGSGESYVTVNPESGKESWRIEWDTDYGVNAADPIISSNRIFISTGYDEGAALFDLKFTPPKQLWKSKVLRTQLNAAVLYQGYIYGFDGDTGNDNPLKCVEFESGIER
jgi:outer membrane protein assembly factor BamB